MKFVATAVICLASLACLAVHAEGPPAAAAMPASAGEPDTLLVLEPQARPEMSGDMAKARATLLQIEQVFADRVADAARARGSRAVVVVDPSVALKDEEKLAVHALGHAATHAIVLHLVNDKDSDGSARLDMQAECVRLETTRRSEDGRPGVHVASVEEHMFRLWGEKGGDSPRSFTEMAGDLVKLLDLAHWF